MINANLLGVAEGGCRAGVDAVCICEGVLDGRPRDGGIAGGNCDEDPAVEGRRVVEPGGLHNLCFFLTNLEDSAGLTDFRLRGVALVGESRDKVPGIGVCDDVEGSLLRAVVTDVDASLGSWCNANCDPSKTQTWLGSLPSSSSSSSSSTFWSSSNPWSASSLANLISPTHVCQSSKNLLKARSLKPNSSTGRPRLAMSRFT